MIGLVMFSLLFFGKSLGISSNLRTLCSIFGAGNSCDFFDFNWKGQIWNLVFLAGMIIGGAIAGYFLTSETSIQLSEATLRDLRDLGIESPTDSMVPGSLFSWQALLSIRGILMLVVGGFMVGFGTRYAGGCTSGHAISGLSNLQLPSLIAVIGFFMGGLFVTYLILPTLLTL